MPVVKTNGFNPVWREELCLPFDCADDMKELIYVGFVVREDGKSGDHEPLDIHCIPLGCLEQVDLQFTCSPQNADYVTIGVGILSSSIEIC